jgi:hypothetical protein
LRDQRKWHGVRFSVVETMPRLPTLAAIFSSILIVAGCATETENVDGSEGAISGAPGPAKDAEKAEIEAMKERAFIAATRKEVILARYAAASPGDFVENQTGTTKCLPQPEYVKQYRWDPYSVVTRSPTYADPDLRLDWLRYRDALHDLSFVPILDVIQRTTGDTHEVSIVASQQLRGICTSQGESSQVYAGARVILRCEGVAKDSGPYPDKCTVPAPGTEDAKPR